MMRFLLVHAYTLPKISHQDIPAEAVQLVA